MARVKMTEIAEVLRRLHTLVDLLVSLSYSQHDEKFATFVSLNVPLSLHES